MYTRCNRDPFLLLLLLAIVAIPPLRSKNPFIVKNPFYKKELKLETHHTDFIVNPEGLPGEESETIFEVLSYLRTERGIPVVAILANGAVAENASDLTVAIQLGLPLVVLGEESEDRNGTERRQKREK